MGFQHEARNGGRVWAPTVGAQTRPQIRVLVWNTKSGLTKLIDSARENEDRYAFAPGLNCLLRDRMNVNRVGCHKLLDKLDSNIGQHHWAAPLGSTTSRDYKHHGPAALATTSGQNHWPAALARPLATFPNMSIMMTMLMMIMLITYVCDDDNDDDETLRHSGTQTLTAKHSHIQNSHTHSQTPNHSHIQTFRHSDIQKCLHGSQERSLPIRFGGPI